MHTYTHAIIQFLANDFYPTTKTEKNYPDTMYNDFGCDPENGGCNVS